jgi:hypothetical protein
MGLTEGRSRSFQSQSSHRRAPDNDYNPYCFQWSCYCKLSLPIVCVYICVRFNDLVRTKQLSPFQNTYKCPVYTTSLRRNAMGVGLVFEADLYTEEHTSHWVLQGVCLTLNTDD